MSDAFPLKVGERFSMEVPCDRATGRPAPGMPDTVLLRKWFTVVEIVGGTRVELQLEEGP